MARPAGDLEQALAALATARRIADLSGRQLLPKLDVAHKAALAAYRRDQGTLAAVFEAEHRVHQARLDALRADRALMPQAIEEGLLAKTPQCSVSS